MSDRKVLIDADVLGRQRTGDESYVENLLRELGQIEARPPIAAITRDPARIPPGIEAVALPARNQLLRTFVRLPVLVRRHRPALAHFQYVAPPGVGVPFAVTVHDLSFEEHPSFFAFHDLVALRTFVRRSVRRAAVVFTVSAWSKERIVERYGLPEESVIVTPDGVDPAFGPEGPRGGGPPYLLFVGAIQPRKDPRTAIRALAELDTDLHLVLAGPDKLGGDEVRRLVRELGLTERVRFRGYVEKSELGALYRGAECLVFPSRYEGFGLPVLEAMACGTPVVAAAAGAVPEVAGAAAVLVPPGDPQALADGVRRARSERETIREAGLERAARFSWTATAERTLEAYEAVL